MSLQRNGLIKEASMKPNKPNKPTLLLIQANYVGKYVEAKQVAVYEVEAVDQAVLDEIFEAKE